MGASGLNKRRTSQPALQFKSLETTAREILKLVSTLRNQLQHVNRLSQEFPSHRPISTTGREPLRCKTGDSTDSRMLLLARIDHLDSRKLDVDIQRPERANGTKPGADEGSSPRCQQLERNDSKGTGSTVNNVDAGVLDSSSYVTEHEFLTFSDKRSTAGQGTEDVDDEGIESVGKRGENAGTTVVSIWLRVLHQIRDRTVLDHDTFRFAGTSTREPV